MEKGREQEQSHFVILLKAVPHSFNYLRQKLGELVRERANNPSGLGYRHFIGFFVVLIGRRYNGFSWMPA